ncbi:hypothetical protein DPMN_173064 [Dreissena polymorpha]|uniref:Uncharacterized protein n=1 Tax=Dreissena polymorpha TaxID=45954 RepID=A0A9D4IH81_DREPO|nr:hypothetical protein DPMN_173064 [Dreissena polymorpha]
MHIISFRHSLPVSEKESCTVRHRNEITLRIDAPSTLYYVAAIWYRIQTEA